MQEVIDATSTVNRMYEIAPILGLLTVVCVGLIFVIRTLWKKLNDQTSQFKEYASEYKEIAKDYNRTSALVQEKLKADAETSKLIYQIHSDVVSIKENQTKGRDK